MNITHRSLSSVSRQNENLEPLLMISSWLGLRDQSTVSWSMA